VLRSLAALEHPQKEITDMMTFAPNQHNYREQPAHELKEGDILDSSWGYEQTNVDFYRVDKILGKKFFLVRKMKSQRIEGSEGFMCDRVVCGSEVVNFDLFKGNVTRQGFLKIKGNLCSVWDGKPMHRSWYA
jgi:hypothetical protein